MCAKVELLVAWRGRSAGERVLLSLNTAMDLVRAGRARWA